MGGIEAEHEAVEKPTTARRTVGEQAVHLRRQPHRADIFSQCRLTFRRRATDPYDPLFIRWYTPGANLNGAMNRFDRGGDGPAIAANRSFLCARQSEVDVGEAR